MTGAADEVCLDIEAVVLAHADAEAISVAVYIAVVEAAGAEDLLC